MSATNVVAEDKKDVDPKIWTRGHFAVIKAAAEDPKVERIFVNAAIKKALCRDAGTDRAFLHKVRPWWGHNYHFHVRIGCPPGSPDCKEQDSRLRCGGLRQGSRLLVQAVDPQSAAAERAAEAAPAAHDGGPAGRRASRCWWRRDHIRSRMAAHRCPHGATRLRDGVTCAAGAARKGAIREATHDHPRGSSGNRRGNPFLSGLCSNHEAIRQHRSECSRRDWSERRPAAARQGGRRRHVLRAARTRSPKSSTPTSRRAACPAP